MSFSIFSDIATKAFVFVRRRSLSHLSFYLYFFFINTSFGMYLTISRDIVRTVMGYNYSFMSLLISLENIPLVFSFIGGGLGDIVGRRRTVLLGFASGVPLFLMSSLDIKYLPLMAALYMFFWYLAQPSITGALLHATSSSGIQYSIYAMFGTIGWGLGGPLAGIIIKYYGWSYAWVAASTITVTAFLIAYVFFPKGVTGGEASVRDIFTASKKILPYFLAALLTVSGFILFFGNYALVLRTRMVQPDLYGLVYTLIPAIVGIVSRPFIGLLSEKTSPINLALTGIMMYMSVITGLYFSIYLPVTIMIVLWSTPVYPFIDQGFVLTFSRSLPKSLQAFASGVWATAFSMGGVVVLIASFSPLINSIWNIYLISEALLFTALTIILTAKIMWKS